MALITDPLLLPSDVHLVPVVELSEQVRSRIVCEVGDVAITRLRSRTPSKVIDSDSANLVERFRDATTIADAVVGYCSDHPDQDAGEVLESAFPVLQDLINSQLLVPADAPQAEQIDYLFRAGQKVGDFTVVRPVQLLEDTEIYQAFFGDGERAAIKIARFAESKVSRRQLRHEATILSHLGSGPSPRLLEEGEAEGRPYLAIEWCEGIGAAEAAGELRLEQTASDLATGPHELLVRIAEAYAKLHERGVLHGDVHPSNLLVDRAGRVRLIDFGLARALEADAGSQEPSRGGVPFFFDPEFAAAQQEDTQPPRVEPAAEQYSLGALLYHLLTGEHYQEFSLEQDQMLRQIREGEPRSFASLGLEPQPAVEKVLRRALAKDPDERYGSVRELADELAAAAETLDSRLETTAPARRFNGVGKALLASLLEEVRVDGALLEDGLPASPTASVNNGAAGIAWTLYRMSMLREEPELLALADVWALSALGQLSDERALYNPAIEMTRETIGEISTFHSPSGLHAVRALISLAMGSAFYADHIAAFVEQAKKPCEEIDLTLGWSSILLTSAALCEALGDDEAARELGLTELGDSYLRKLWQRLDALPSIRDASEEIPFPGIAHGWGGFVYATLRWCQAAGHAIPDQLERRLDELAALAELVGRGARWPWRLDAERPVFMPGWCNGSAGFVFLWTLAHHALGKPSYLEMAERAVWNTWEDPARVANLCCGFAGRGYAVLHWFKQTGEERWLERAHRLADQAARAIREVVDEDYEGFEFSLYKGEVGVAALVADLEHPEASAFPFFEPDGWPAARPPTSETPAE